MNPLVKDALIAIAAAALLAAAREVAAIAIKKL